MRKPRVPSQFRTVLCSLCQSSFQTNHSRGKYCSEKCQRIGARKSWNKYSAKNRDSRNAYHRDRYAADPVAVMKRIVEYLRTPEGKRARQRTDKNQRQSFPEKIKARSAVAVALRKGVIQRQPCEFHPCSRTAQAHHDDYSKPLAVRWLCADHHARLLCRNGPLWDRSKSKILWRGCPKLDRNGPMGLWSR